MPEPAVYRTPAAQRVHRRRQLRDAIREEVSRTTHCTCQACAQEDAALTDRIMARFDRIEDGDA